MRRQWIQQPCKCERYCGDGTSPTVVLSRRCTHPRWSPLVSRDDYRSGSSGCSGVCVCVCLSYVLHPRIAEELLRALFLLTPDPFVLPNLFLSDHRPLPMRVLNVTLARLSMVWDVSREPALYWPSVDVKVVARAPSALPRWVYIASASASLCGVERRW